MRDELWLVFDLLQENPLWRQGFLTRLKCPASVVYNKGWGSEVAQLGSAGRNVSAPWRHKAKPFINERERELEKQ